MAKEASKVPAPTDKAELDKLETKLLGEAKTPQERQLAYSLVSQARQASMVRSAALAVAETGWGAQVSPMTRAAVVRYCFEIGADPFQHVNVLGGNIYLNARFWMDLVAANPEFLRATTDFIHDDERASEEERQRRQLARIQYGVPEKAPGAAAVTLFYKDRGPFVGVNWAGVREKDPVGKAEPTKTAESRAYRRAALKAEPAWFGKHPRLQTTHEMVASEVVVLDKSPYIPAQLAAEGTPVPTPAEIRAADRAADAEAEREPGEEG